MFKKNTNSVSVIDAINEMSDEEVAALNAELTKTLVKTVAIKVAIHVGIAVAAHIVLKKLEEKNIIPSE
jgi:cytochrome b561